MLIDAGDLSEFYETLLGQVARRIVLRRIREFWPALAGRRVLGYGFAIPYLRSFLGEAERVIALAPPHQGFVNWPEHRPLVTMAEEDALPFPDAVFDHILVIHGLESAEATRPLMRQLWRVMAPSGTLLIVAPNRTSIWSQIDRSPFAHGRPYNRGQLERLLRESMFAPERWETALLFPPFKTRRLLNTGAGWERVGRRFWPRLAGVQLVEASKSLYGVIPPARAAKARTKLATAR